MTRYIFCDATRVSPSQFLDYLLGREPKSPEQKARELAEWQEQTRRECAEYRAGMEARDAAMSVSDVLGEQVERDLRRTLELGDAARAARAVAAAQSRRVSPSRPSGLPSLSQRKSA